MSSFIFDSGAAVTGLAVGLGAPPKEKLWVEAEDDASGAAAVRCVWVCAKGLEGSICATILEVPNEKAGLAADPTPACFTVNELKADFEGGAADSSDDFEGSAADSSDDFEGGAADSSVDFEGRAADSSVDFEGRAADSSDDFEGTAAGE